MNATLSNSVRMSPLVEELPGTDLPAARCLHCFGCRLRPASRNKWTYRDETCELVVCDDCRGQFSDPLPSSELLEKFYKDTFNYDWYRQHYPAKFLDSIHRIWQYRRLGLVPNRSFKLLDYGGSMGYFARAAGYFGIDAASADPMLEHQDASGNFDIVTCHHVIEHAPHPEELLRKIRELLASNGALILAVPNAASTGYAKLREGFVWSQPPFMHIHHFTAAGLREILKREGWEVTHELFFERWDANTLADVRLAHTFGRWDSAWASARFPRLTAQINSVRRFVALALSPMLARVSLDQKSELVMVARPSSRSPN